MNQYRIVIIICIIQLIHLYRPRRVINWFDEQGGLYCGWSDVPAHVAARQEWHRREGWRVPGE